MTTINTIPNFSQEPPSTSDPDHFDERADAAFADLHDSIIPDMNTSIGQMNTVADEVESNKTATNSNKEDCENAETSAIAARDKAEKWANEVENVEVETGEYSAKHFVAKAERWANEAENVEIETGKYSALHFAAKAEAAVAVLPEGTIDDNLIATDKTWSSDKINIELNTVIEKPSVIYPTDTGTGLPISFSAIGTTYRSLYDYSQADAQIQISKVSDFSVLEINDLLGTAGTSFNIAGLEITTLYYCKIRYQNSAGVWSEWSDIISFTTATIYIDTPTNISPADTEANIIETLELSSDAFECIGGTDTHLSSDWEVYSDVELTNLVWSSYDDTSNLESIIIPVGNLLDGETSYYWRCRYTGATQGDSEWSTVTSFTTQASFANIIGIALVSAGGGAGTWQQIDAVGNNVAPDAAFFSNHAVYGNISDVTIDGQAMVKIPKFYIKTGTVPAGDQVGKKAKWISDVPVSGFSLHPAFMDAGVEIDQFYYAAYEATNDGGTKAGSIAGVKPLVDIDFPTMQSRCTARNTGGVEGFHMLNIHELSAVQVLCLIKEGTPDVQAVIGAGNVSSSAAVNTGTTNAVWYGIHELWGNVWCMVDGVQFDTNNQIKVFDQNGNGTYVSTGVTASATDGWITGMHDDSGTGFNLGMLFLGKTFDGTEGNGTFGDYEWSPDANENNICYHGGGWAYGTRTGLFYLGLHNVVSDSNTYIGSRLAKV